MFHYHQPSEYVRNPCSLFTCRTKPAGLKIPPQLPWRLCCESPTGACPQSSLCLPSDGQPLPGDEEQLPDQISPSPRSVCGEVSLSFAITRFSGSLGGTSAAGRVCVQEEVAAADREVLLSPAG